MAVKRAVARVVRAPRRRLAQRRIERGFVSGFLGDADALNSYRRELVESGLIDHLRERAADFRRDLGGPDESRYTMGTIAYDEGVYLYALMRRLAPRTVVETGVCNGFSTAFVLAALEKNGAGELHSLDFPEVVGEDYAPGTFWEGKGPAAIPPGREPGWVIPEPLRDRWHLTLGKSQETLPPLLERLGEIDAFAHDSEHSYDCMRFEYGAAWPALREGGVLVSDDVNSTPAFGEFAREHKRDPVHMGPGIAFLVK